jgi:superfamily II RNA helicase
MAYTKNNWINGVTPINGTNLNKIEQGIYEAHKKLEDIEYEVGGNVSNSSFKHLKDKVTSNINDIAKEDKKLSEIQNYTLKRCNKDKNGVFTTIQHLRENNTKILVSTLSGGTNPLYTTRTVKYYSNSNRLLKTETYKLSYDSDGILVSEVLQS